MRTDHCVFTDMDIALVEDRGLWETDDAALTELAKIFAFSGVRSDSAIQTHQIPHDRSPLFQERVKNTDETRDQTTQHAPKI